MSHYSCHTVTDQMPSNMSVDQAQASDAHKCPVLGADWFELSQCLKLAQVCGPERDNSTTPTTTACRVM